jgi:hypothetical protein
MTHKKHKGAHRRQREEQGIADWTFSHIEHPLPG